MKRILLIIKTFIILIIFSISFLSLSFADNPILEYGQIDISSDGEDASGGTFYLKVLGQDKFFNGNQIISQNGSYIWQGNILFNGGTSPLAGEEHVVAVEKEINGIGYYAVTSKLILNTDIPAQAGIQFPSVRFTKMYKPICINNVGKIVLTIADVETAHNDDNLWGYRVYRQVDGGPYEFFNDVTAKDAQLFIDNTVTIAHAYKYKYKILTKNKEYEGQYFSDESDSYSPFSQGCTQIDISSIPTPDITSISHTYGSVDGGLYITLSGVDFDGGSIFVDGELVTVAQKDSVQFFTPPHSSGMVNIRVQKMAGKYSEVTFNYLNNPTINVCSPKSGTVLGGTIVEINGNYLYQGITPVVTIGNKIAEIQGQPANEKVTIITPDHSVGKVAVKVDLGNKVEAAKEEAYEYLNPPPVEGDPAISHVVPSKGTGGTGVIIAGVNFSSPKVYFGNQESVVTNSSSGFIFVAAPQNPPGTVDVKVINNNGQGKTVIKKDGFIYIMPQSLPQEEYPAINNIYPKEGVSGDMMVISGESLSLGMEPLVLFGVTTNTTNKLSLAAISNYSSQSVVVTVPYNPATQNSVNVFLIRADDGKSVMSPVQFTYLTPTNNPMPIAKPMISNIDPATGNAKDIVVISGTNLCNGAKPEVFFGSTAFVNTGTVEAEITHHSDQIVVVKVPNKPSTEKSVDVYLKRKDREVSKSPVKFTYEEIILLGSLDIQSVFIDGVAVRNNDYINKALTSAVVYIDFTNSSAPSSGNAAVSVNGTALNVSFSAPVTVNNKLISTANITGTALSQFSNALVVGQNNISIAALSNNGEKTITNNYILNVASEDDELKLLPLPDGNLLLNYPNPFNPNGGQTTDIAFVLNKDGILDIYIYDIKGALIYKREINAHTGYNTYTWNGISDFGDTSGTGTYFYRMVDQIETRVLGTAKLTIINK